MLYLPFDTYYREQPGMSRSEQLAETNALIQRQAMIADCVDGQASADDLLDLLEWQQIDPLDYVDMAEQNVIFLLSQP